MTHSTLIVFSHLRWYGARERPRQILSRLARDRRVVFVEAPVHDDRSPRLVCSRPMPGVDVLVPHTPVPEVGFGDAQLALISRLVTSFARQQAIAHPVVWLCTPLALPLAAPLGPRAVVYDCMDDRPTLPRSPTRLAEREAALLAQADLVLTGAPMQDARRRGQRNVYCVPSTVDATPFEWDHAVDTVRRLLDGRRLRRAATQRNGA